MNISGIFPPITTPFDDRDEIDLAALAANVGRYMKTRLSGVVVLGSNGEAPMLTEDEGFRMVAAARQVVPRDRVLIAGAGEESTRATVTSARGLAAAGADAILVRTPAYFKTQLTQDVLIRHFTAVADASPIPVIMYNATPFTGVSLLPPAVARLAEHPNIIGIKETMPDIAQVTELVAVTPAGFQVVVGSLPTLFASLCVGAVGGIVAGANVIPDLCVQLYDLVQQKKFPEALALQRRLTPLARSVTAVYGPGGLKAAMDLAGYVGGRPRAPLPPASPQAMDVIRKQLTDLSS
ncbi:MAG: dihydrodipicolinate synthase family protein [Acidobacteria bacterium]|nr:dihydrodipicolinate synthase family protein [Acidobacteriota bacterium]